MESLQADHVATTQLLIAMGYWTHSLNYGCPADIIYLDFCKALDSVPHNRLLTKLKAYGISGCLFHWMQDLLSRRKERVVLNGDHSIQIVGLHFPTGFQNNAEIKEVSLIC